MMIERRVGSRFALQPEVRPLATSSPNDPKASVDRRAQLERRQGERRKKNLPVAFERRSGPDRRQGERRRQVDPTTCEREYSSEEVEFMRAMEMYKRLNQRPFPTWSEVLEVLRSLGYRRVAEPGVLPGTKVSAVSSVDAPA
jgi:hypothetical protein